MQASHDGRDPRRTPRRSPGWSPRRRPRRPDEPGGRVRTDDRVRVAVDVDGVLFDHLPHIHRAFREADGVDLAEEGFRHWDFQAYDAVREAGLDREAVRAVLDRVETNPRLHRAPPLDRRAPSVMASWRSAGCSVEVVTARGEVSRAVTELFLAANGIPHDELHMDVAEKTAWDLIVDDAPANARAAARAGTPVLLMDQPYNRSVDEAGPIRRVRDWAQARAAAAPLLAEAPA